MSSQENRITISPLKEILSKPNVRMVGYGAYATTESTERYLLTFGLSSCIALIFWDKNSHKASMAHIPTTETFPEYDPKKGVFSPHKNSKKGIIKDMLDSLGNETEKRIKSYLIGGNPPIEENKEKMVKSLNRILEELRKYNIKANKLDIFSCKDERTIVFDKQTGEITDIPS